MHRSLDSRSSFPPHARHPPLPHPPRTHARPLTHPPFPPHPPIQTHADVPCAELDLEPRAIHLHVPTLYALDVDLDLPDAALPPSLPATRGALELKRARDLDVDGARAEWHVAEDRLLLFA